MKLALGTVQFGMSYGIANRSGLVAPSEVKEILRLGREHGLDTLDTAIAYGNSEQVLGDIGVGDWNLNTKIPSLPYDCTDVERWMMNQVESSMRRLGVSSLSGVLLHNAADVLGEMGAKVARGLRALKLSGVAHKIGFSIYSPEILPALMKICIPDLIQAPMNVIDRRLSESGWLQRLRADGIEIHVRSVFMQGLLLMSSEKRPPYFARWQPLWDRWEAYLASACDASTACLGFIKSFPEISRVVVGVDNKHQLVQLINSFESISSYDLPPSTLSCAESDLVDPVNWRV